jgi:hypothetical protein
MSKFQSTVSVVAALASIFGAGAAGWKLAADSQRVPEPVAEEKIAEPETDVAKPAVTVATQPVAPPPVALPEATPAVQPTAPTLPVAPPPPVTETTQP